MKYSIIDILWCAVAFSLTIFLFIPLPIYLSNREELLTSDSLVISNCLIVAILSTVALTVPLLLAPRKLRKAVLALLVFITLSVWTQANLFNWNYGLFDGSELPWKLIEWRTVIDISVWLLILVGIFYWGVIKEGPYRPVLSLLLFIQLFNLGYAYTHSRTQELAEDRTVRGAHVVPANKFNFGLSALLK